MYHDLNNPTVCEALHDEYVAKMRQGAAPVVGSPEHTLYQGAELKLRAHRDPAFAAKLAEVVADGRDAVAAQQTALARNDPGLTAALAAEAATSSHDGGPVERANNAGDLGWLDRANALRANPSAVITHTERVDLEKASADDAHRTLVAHERFRRGLPVNVIGSEPARPSATTAPIASAMAKGGPVWAKDRNGVRFDLAGLLSDTIDAAIKARLASV